jgi:hypothetical protein
VTCRCFAGELLDQRRLKAIGVPRFRRGRHAATSTSCTSSSRSARVQRSRPKYARSRGVHSIARSSQSSVPRPRPSSRGSEDADASACPSDPSGLASPVAMLAPLQVPATPGCLWQSGGNSRGYAPGGSDAQVQPCPGARPVAFRDGATTHSAAREEPGKVA